MLFSAPNKVNSLSVNESAGFLSLPCSARKYPEELGSRIAATSGKRPSTQPSMFLHKVHEFSMSDHFSTRLGLSSISKVLIWLYLTNLSSFMIIFLGEDLPSYFLHHTGSSAPNLQCVFRKNYESMQC